jgi:pimeloyl-ACP methyl ester carboxylesterase
LKLYCLGGIGADERLYRDIVPDNTEMIAFDWIPPYSDETLKEYAARLIKGIDTREPYALIGVSFGSVVALEMARIHKPIVLVQLSGINERKQLPFIYRFAGALRLHRIIPVHRFIRPGKLVYWFFGIEREEDKTLLKAVLNDTHHSFVKWAVHALLTWKNENPVELVTIHGDKDRILPLKRRKPDHLIEDSGHFMIRTHAVELRQILQETFYQLSAEIPAFEVEAIFQMTGIGIFVLARLIDYETEFTMSDNTRLGNVPIKKTFNLPDLTDDEGRPRDNIFEFQLKNERDRNRLHEGEKVLLVNH